MEFISTLIDLFLHLDEHLRNVTAMYGTWTYLLLFVVIFCETGLVVTPFLPGDSLLFAAGALAALGGLSLWWLVILLIVAAVLGDTVNYWIGHYIGPRAFSGNIRFLRKDYLDRTQAFYEKHGGKTIILARFVPIVRTFAPFVAGIGTMDYSRFIVFNVVGAVVWVLLFTLVGFFFGNLPFVEKNFSLVILVIIAISVAPIVFEYVRDRYSRREQAATENA
ncbi:MAG: Protein DedA [Anaerolineae bacterium]|nr:Protein DedA [Anaerolineae bacterium]